MSIVLIFINTTINNIDPPQLHRKRARRHTQAPLHVFKSKQIQLRQTRVFQIDDERHVDGGLEVYFGFGCIWFCFCLRNIL